MCVILIAQENRLTAATILAAIESNPDGNGFAWVQGGKVHWRKGITAKAAIKLAQDKPLPYVFHARIATVGKPCAALCHPFPVAARNKQTATIGTSARGIIFHNGSWNEWAEHVNATNGKRWSDSRGIADMLFADGRSMLALIPETQRVVLMTPKEITYHGRGWTALDDGTMASNTHFVRRRRIESDDWSGYMHGWRQ